MQELLILLVIAFPLMALVGLILSIVALTKAGKQPDAARLESRLDDVTVRLVELERRRRLPDVAPEPAPAAGPAEDGTDESVPQPPELPVLTPPPVPEFDPSTPSADPPPQSIGADPDDGAPRMPASPPETPAAAAKASLDWEQWLGVRGAALMGALVLALAGLYFFKYSIEHGWISPSVRIVLGTLTGLGCVLGSESLRGRGYRYGADALAGGGVVVLYASFWAAHVLFQLISSAPAFILMAMLTAACVALAGMRRSPLVATVGLLGGFATPLFISGIDDAFGLFGYLLILDAGIIYLALKRQWPVMALLALVGTTVHQLIYFIGAFGSFSGTTALAILALFGALFGLLWWAKPAGSSDTWRLTQFAAIVVPFGFGIFFAGQHQVAIGFPFLLGFLLLLSGGACITARRIAFPALATAASALDLGILWVWFERHPMPPSAVWQWVLGALLIAGLFHAFDVTRRRDGQSDGSWGSTTAYLGFFIVSLMVGLDGGQVDPWPFLCLWVGLLAIGQHRSCINGSPIDAFAGPLALGLGGALWFAFKSGVTGVPIVAFAGALLAAQLAVHFWSIRVSDGVASVWRDRGCVAMGVVVVLALSGIMNANPTPLVYFGLPLVFALLALAAAVRCADGFWFLVVMLATAFTDWLGLLQSSSNAFAPTMSLLIAALVMFMATPFALHRRLEHSPMPWQAAALAVVVWFLPIVWVFEDGFGDQFIGLAPLGLAAMALVAAYGCRRIWAPDHPRFKSALVWFLAVCLACVTAAIPVQLEREWITIAWALEACALSFLWLRLDHKGLKYVICGLVVATALRLMVNPSLFHLYPPVGGHIFNWMMYTYLIPVAALAVSARVLATTEVVRLGDGERGVFGARPWVAILSGAVAILLGFVWINLAINHYFRPDAGFVFDVRRSPARDLTFSIAWILYAMGLMALGIGKRITALRRVSLGLLMLTISKVFLYDLGELQDLYRVASLLGLAASLIAVSVIYQKFVSPKAQDGGGQ